MLDLGSGGGGRVGLVAWLRVGQAYGVFHRPVFGLLVSVPRSLSTQPPFATQALIGLKSMGIHFSCQSSLLLEVSDYLQRRKQARKCELQAKKEAREKEKQERQLAREQMKIKRDKDKLLKKVSCKFNFC